MAAGAQISYDLINIPTVVLPDFGCSVKVEGAELGPTLVEDAPDASDIPAHRISKVCRVLDWRPDAGVEPCSKEVRISCDQEVLHEVRERIATHRNAGSVPSRIEAALSTTAIQHTSTLVPGVGRTTPPGEQLARRT